MDTFEKHSELQWIHHHRGPERDPHRAGSRPLKVVFHFFIFFIFLSFLSFIAIHFAVVVVFVVANDHPGARLRALWRRSTRTRVELSTLTSSWL